MVRGAVSPDHIHVLLSAPSILTPAKLAQYIKGDHPGTCRPKFPEFDESSKRLKAHPPVSK
jgi:REP-associated tyrosine transposase